MTISTVLVIRAILGIVVATVTIAINDISILGLGLLDAEPSTSQVRLPCRRIKVARRCLQEF